MSGSFSGGLKASLTNKLRHGDDYYRRIGAKGGANSRGGGFTKETAAVWGALGGSMSRRSPSKLSEAERKQRREKFQKQYEKTLQRLQNVHAAAMQGREQS